MWEFGGGGFQLVTVCDTKKFCNAICVKMLIWLKLTGGWDKFGSVKAWKTFCGGI